MHPPVGHLTEKMSSTQCDEGVIRTEGILLHPYPWGYEAGARCELCMDDVLAGSARKKTNGKAESRAVPVGL